MLLKNHLKRIMPSLSSVAFVLVWFAIAPRCERLSQRQTAAIPDLTRRKGKTLFLT